MTGISVDPESFLAEVERFIGEPPISYQQYRDRVESIADTIMEEYPEDMEIEDRIFEAVDSSGLVLKYHMMGAPIKYHNNEPDEIGPFIQSNPVQGLAFVCLRADVRREVYDRKEEK